MKYLVFYVQDATQGMKSYSSKEKAENFIVRFTKKHVKNAVDNRICGLIYGEVIQDFAGVFDEVI